MSDRELTREELEQMGTIPTKRMQELKRWVWEFCLATAYRRMAKAEQTFWEANPRPDRT